MRANEIRSLRTEEKDIWCSTQMYKNVCFHVKISCLDKAAERHGGFRLPDV